MAMKAAVRPTRRWLVSRWGYLVFVASQFYLGRSVWGKAADGDPSALGSLAFGVIILGGAVWYKVRWTRRSRQTTDGSAGQASAE